MRNIRVFLSSGFLMAAFSAPVLAQGSDILGPYVGANVGFHTSDDEGTGYQAGNLDINELVRDLVGDDVFDELQDEFEEEFENVGGDDTEGGALIGVGLEFDIIENGAIRLTVDTIEFDSARFTTGFSFRF